MTTHFPRQHNGFTYAEILIAVFVLSVGIVGILLLFSNAMLSSEYAWDIVQATSHAENILEDMKARNSLFEIRSVDWDQWAQKEDLKTLPEETVDVQFAQTSLNLLETFVTVSWMRKSRKDKIVLKTKITK